MCDYMPVEVIREILKRLSVKSLVRFRSVCKTWNSLICDPSFISTHLQASLSNNSPFLLRKCSTNRQKSYFLHYDNDGFDEFKQLQFPVSGGFVSDAVVLGSCNGLICFNFWPSYILNFLLWNPSIQKYIFLPRPSISDDEDFKIGFGFDWRTGDYKLLLFGVDLDDSWIEPYLFSLNENSWKRVNAIPPDYTFDTDEVPVPFVNGALHWLGYQKRNNDEYSNAILGFDLSAEEFFEISLPESLSGLHYMDLSSTKKYGESSIAVLRRESGYTELFEWWVMKEYGVFESWTKLLTLDLEYIPRIWFPRVLGFRKNGQVLLHVANGRMASLDLNSQQMELHGVEGIEGIEVVTGRIYLEGSYVESLVLLDKAVVVHSGAM